MTRSVRDAIVVHEVLADRRVQLPRRPLAQWRFAVPTRLCSTASTRPSRAPSTAASRRSRRRCADRDDRRCAAAEIAPINADGSFPAAESWAFHRRWLAEREAEYDRRVALRIRRGETMSAADYIDLVAARRDWIAR